MNITRKCGQRPGVSTALVLACLTVLLAGCGGSNSNAGVARLSAPAPSPGGTSGASPSSSGPGAAEAEELAFAKCMRANGLPGFPDPRPGGGFVFPSGGNGPASPAFKAAQSKCRKYRPPGPGSGPPPSAQTLARFLKIAQCMRAHGVPAFPDPRSSMPSNLKPPSGASRFVISDIEGVILVMGSIDTQSPTFVRAAAACAFPLEHH
jgi:hypothetical protein